MTEPLVPAEVDLRDFPYMPLEVARLRKSKAWLVAKKRPELGFYWVNLWTASWHERPPGSLEDDDEVLADAAMCPPGRWAKLRADILRGWVKCSDGRLYHPTVAEKAREAWAAKLEQRRRTAAATAARNVARETQRNVLRDDKRNGERDDGRNEQRDDNVASTSRSPREGNRREVLKPSVVETPTVEAPNPHNALSKQGNGKSATRWDESDEGIDAKGRELGMTPRPGETYFDFKHRLWNEINVKSRHAQ